MLDPTPFGPGQIGLRSDIANVNKRLDDVNMHLADQSRRIDAVREELSARIDAMREELNHRMDGIDARIDETNKRIDETNQRLDRLYEAIVRRDEHSSLVIKINELDHEVREIKQQLAA